MPHATIPPGATVAVGFAAAPGRAPSVRAAAPAPDLGVGVERIVYVAPGGRDGNPGTRAAPVATLERARALVQPHLAGMAGDVLIVLRGGRYQLSSTFALGPADSGHNGHRVRYVAAPGERPVLSGGEPVSGWQQSPTQSWLWTAPLPTGITTVRQLFVGGVRAARVRGPWPTGGGTMTRTTTGWSFSAGTNPIASWQQLQGITLRFHVQWMDHHLPIASMDSTTITMRDVQNAPWTAATTGIPGYPPLPPPTYVEHAKELLSATTTGQFWLDSTAGLLYYVPRPGEALASPLTVALTPQRGPLAQVQGSGAAPAHHISFEGLTFSEASWLGVEQTGLASDGLSSYWPSCPTLPPTLQQTVLVPGALEVSNATDVTVAACTFARLGGTALRLFGGTSRCVVRDCTFSDLSGAGVTLGDWGSVAFASTGNQITGCTFADCGQEYQSCAPIELADGAGTLVQHNHIVRCPYDGIGRGSPPPGADRRGVQILDNRIEQPMQALVDGGAIYTNSDATGLLVRRNYCSGAPAYGPGGLIYLDVNSSGANVQDNVALQGGAGGPPIFWFNGDAGPSTLSYNWSDAASASGTPGPGGKLALNRLVGSGTPAPASVTAGAGTAAAPAPQCSAPQSLALGAQTPASSSLTLSWSAPRAGTPAFYEVWMDALELAGVCIGTTTGTTFVFADLVPGGQYVFRVRAVDGAGGVSAPSAPLALAAPAGTVERTSYGSGWE